MKLQNSILFNQKTIGFLLFILLIINRSYGQNQSKFGAVGIISENQHLIIRRVILIAGLSIWLVLKKTDFICINLVGNQNYQWHIFYLIGTGLTE